MLKLNRFRQHLVNVENKQVQVCRGKNDNAREPKQFSLKSSPAEIHEITCFGSIINFHLYFFLVYQSHIVEATSPVAQFSSLIQSFDKF